MVEWIIEPLQGPEDLDSVLDVDALSFTRPWTLSLPLYRIVDQPDMELLEFECIPFTEEFMYGTLKKK